MARRVRAKVRAGLEAAFGKGSTRRKIKKRTKGQRKLDRIFGKK